MVAFQHLEQVAEEEAFQHLEQVAEEEDFAVAMDFGSSETNDESILFSNSFNGPCIPGIGEGGSARLLPEL
jgi:hypothetical protein